MTTWHRGDQVVDVMSGQYGVVDGWKNGRVLVHWGTHDSREFRSWHDDINLVHAATAEKFLP